MEHRCQCCGTPLSGSVCSYCGFREIIDMDQDGMHTVKNMADKHKSYIYNQIRDISVMTYPYKWNPSTSALEGKGEEEILLADGKDCIKTFWSKECFGQMTPGKEITLKLSYRLECGRKQKYICEAKITPVECNDFWKLGLLIGPSLRLQVLLGTSKRYAVSAEIPLELK